MIRLIIRTDDAAMACNVGGAVETKFRTFDVNLPEVEAFLAQPVDEKWGYTQRQILGIEFIPPSSENDE